MIFYPLEKLLFLTEGYQRSFNINGRDLLLIQHQNETFLIDNRCPHQEKSLTKGKVFNGCIRCPYHGLEFELKTGLVANLNKHANTQYRLIRYKLHYQGDRVGCYL